MTTLCFSGADLVWNGSILAHFTHFSDFCPLLLTASVKGTLFSFLLWDDTWNIWKTCRKAFNDCQFHPHNPLRSRTDSHPIFYTESRCTLSYVHAFAFGGYLYWRGRKVMKLKPWRISLRLKKHVSTFLSEQAFFFSNFILHHCHPSAQPLALGKSGDRTLVLHIAATIKSYRGNWGAATCDSVFLGFLTKASQMQGTASWLKSTRVAQNVL